MVTKRQAEWMRKILDLTYLQGPAIRVLSLKMGLSADSNNAVVEMFNRLEAKGMVMRSRDGRSRILTQAGITYLRTHP